MEDYVSAAKLTAAKQMVPANDFLIWGLMC